MTLIVKVIAEKLYYKTYDGRIKGCMGYQGST